MNGRLFISTVMIVLGLGIGERSAVAADGNWHAGVARVNITPKGPMWLSGYASRSRPYESKLHDLWAKALVLKDSQGRVGVFITLDLIGIDRQTSLVIRRGVMKKYRLKLSQICLATSHTHSGPVVGKNLGAMYFLKKADREKIRLYTQRLIRQVRNVVDQAFKNLGKASLSYTHGHSDIAVNRRTNPESRVPALRKANKLKGRVDHDVPILSVRSLKGELKTVVFGYACHATVLSGYQLCGDYPGFAQIQFEKQYPGAMAMFFAGCGGDQNPLPRRKVALAKDYGKRLAHSVHQALREKMNSIRGPLTTRYAEIPLKFDRIPTQSDLEIQMKSGNRYVRRRAELLMKKLKTDGRLTRTYPYPVQAWRIGDELNLIMLGGEVVVDYSLRLKRELGSRGTFVAAYCNDVMAYIPSERVLKEGGYEGEGAMVYYGQPSRWATGIENQIIMKVRELVKLHK